jgi:FkbM family methyltransferase
MESVHREHLLEGLVYYLKSVLFVRPVGRFIIRLVGRILVHKYHEFKLWNVFMVFNRDVGAIPVHGSRYYAYAWRYEEKPSSLFKCLLKVLRRGVFVDVGAYIGFYTVFAARHGWKVVAFEPNPISLVLLRYNIALHGVGDRVVVVDKAAGDVHGYARFSISSSPSESSFTKVFEGRAKGYLMIDAEVVTIDSVLESIGVKDVDKPCYEG